jgi:acetoin utilization protein AcuB
MPSTPNAEPVTVQQLMTRGVVTVGLDQTLGEVRNIFRSRPFHHVVVLEDDRVVGVLSDRDIWRNVSPFVGKLAERPVDAASLNRRVHQVMTRAPRTATPEMPATDAARIMLDSGFSCLPVVDDRGGCIGIVTIRDYARWAAEVMGGESSRAA